MDDRDDDLLLQLRMAAMRAMLQEADRAIAEGREQSKYAEEILKELKPLPNPKDDPNL